MSKGLKNWNLRWLPFYLVLNYGLFGALAGLFVQLTDPGKEKSFLIACVIGGLAFSLIMARQHNSGTRFELKCRRRHPAPDVRPESDASRTR
ncbi:MAG: hypothetical protein ACI97B_001383 [Verrucomicrobiales bacterium]|jgi:hypothetical protein